jgi:putative heme-binding domain-containing protein
MARVSAFLIAALVVFPSRAAEPWADKRLPTSSHDGLIVWLDAEAQSAARAALGKPVLTAMGPIDAWYDGSGQRNHFGQNQKEYQPIFREHGPGASLLFDGEDDVLTFAGPKREVRAMTIFLVAAPAANTGDFRAPFAGHEPGKNDYTSGINIDFGPWATPRWQTLNAEGPGFGGAINMLDRGVDFGAFHTVALVNEPGLDSVRLFFDGRAAGKRGRAKSVLRLDEMIVGSRIYNNEGGRANPRGFFDGDIAEVLVYDRALKDNERQVVEKYLREKYAKVTPVALARGGPGSKPLVPVKNPPPVQVFVPGFTAREVPVDLPNINNIRYRADGKLVALGYNGNIYLISEDGGQTKVERWYENKGSLLAPIGMALTPPGFKHGQGVIVAAKGKVVLLTDSTGGGKADKEIIVADKWEPYPPELSTHGVDALGVAIDKDGVVYFGLGCKSYVNAYMIDKDGQSHYDLKSERGTILKVAPDFSKREIVCTGIRFPVGLAFNRHGDLFATDQEGATWLPNGNPFDELLHIQHGRHYGFPPRHPKHLPNVIDEPSTFDYGPQHQSTCGFCFNEPVNGGPTFGPAIWAGDAFVTGYSRGKLYRTKLVKTPSGYVAQNQIFACLNMLTVDTCVSPKGDLIVACHSGLPDWGSGPSGKGKLYKISYTDRDEPQPVLAWSAGPREVRLAFDRPLSPQRLSEVTRGITIEHGPYVRAGDRFESLRPGYAVVQMQLRAPRYELPVLSVNVTPDRRTLILATTPTRAAHHYAVTLPGKTETDIEFTLNGVQAELVGKATYWLPHVDLDVARALAEGSAEHDPLWNRPRLNGYVLELRTRLDLWGILRPAVQPGSRLDYALPAERVRLHPLGGPEVMPVEGQPIPVKALGGFADTSFSTQEDPRPRSFALRRFLLPWAELKPEPIVATNRDVPELKGGSWAHGREVFFGPQANCSKCHKINGAGGAIGPDLSNLIHRDYDSVLRDIRLPSAAINPDHLTSIVELTDGKSLTGVLRKRGDRLVVGDTGGNETEIDPARVESIMPSPVSTMPEGLDRILGPEKLRDLLTFLLTEPLSPAPIEAHGEPPPRSRAEVEAILKDSPVPKGPFRNLHIVLSSGPKDHGPGEHDYPLFRRRWVKLFDLADNVTVSECDGFPKPALLAKAEVVVFYSANPGWDAERAKELDAFLSRGGGAMFIHYAVDGHRDAEALAKLIGLAWRGGTSKFRHGALDMTIADHQITGGLPRLKLIDESYWNLVGDPATVTLLASGIEEGKPQPLMWSREHGKGRVFVSIPGHYSWSFDDPLFRLLLLRGIAWSAHEPVVRFQGLIWPGARVGLK